MGRRIGAGNQVPQHHRNQHLKGKDKDENHRHAAGFERLVRKPRSTLPRLSKQHAIPQLSDRKESRSSQQHWPQGKVIHVRFLSPIRSPLAQIAALV